MQRQVLRVIIIDDDGLGVREEVFKQFFQLEAERAVHRLELTIYTAFPTLDELIAADVISWDNDLGGDSMSIRHLRRLQFEDPERLLEILGRKTHIIHSMNHVAVESLFQVLHKDLGAKVFKIAFAHMKDRVQSLS